MSLYRDVGVVLRTYKLGESDRIVVIHTKAHGKVRAVAKGVRKTSSRFGSRLEPLSHIVVQLYQGRDLDIVSQVELVETFKTLRTDLDRMSRGAAIVEVIDQLSQERQPNARLYDMAVGALRAVDHWPSPLVVPALYLKLLAADGVGIDFDRCAVCSSEDGLVSLSLRNGGVLCANHRDGMAMSDQARRIMSLIVSGRMNAALELPVGTATFEVDRLATSLMESHIERRLSAARVLDGA